jgi:hypothetical protein
MQLQLSTYIAGRKTVADWISIRNALNDFGNAELWTSVFDDYFLTRLNDRYLDPIKSIKQDGCYSGEGFSIMTIICSLVEFLETTYQGRNYRFRRKGDPELEPFEYSASGQIFVDFLTNRNPFSLHFNTQTALDFYSNIRCGLLHEARTNGKWTIWGKSPNNDLMEKNENAFIVFRDDFCDALLNFININYKAELLSSTDRKQAFLRKYDRLCEV